MYEIRLEWNVILNINTGFFTKIYSISIFLDSFYLNHLVTRNSSKNGSFKSRNDTESLQPRRIYVVAL